MTILKDMNELNWVEVCALDDITPNTGVGALIENQQIALFRVGHEKRVYALSNQDPFSKAFVMSRGILGDLQGERVVASPIYKQHFSLVGKIISIENQGYVSPQKETREWRNRSTCTCVTVTPKSNIQPVP